MTRIAPPPPAAMKGAGMTSQRARDRLIERLRIGGIKDEAVLEVMGALPRHLFIDEALASRAYEDTALPIGMGQTISQPYVVALMTQSLRGIAGIDKVLEIGTGSGYQAAVLAKLFKEVFTIERIDELLRMARKRFRQLGLNIRSKHDDGNIGWPEYAPFDAVIATAARESIDPRLLDQVRIGGIVVAPIGPPGQQTLVRMTRGAEGWSRESLGAVSFVPWVKGVA